LVELFHGGVVEEVGVGGELHGGVLDLGDFNLRGTLDNA
jgi:hypothetical protein